MDPFSIVIGAIVVILILVFVEILPTLLKLALFLAVVFGILYFGFGITFGDVTRLIHELVVLTY